LIRYAKSISGLLLSALALYAAADGPWFKDVTEAAGIRHRHTKREFDNPYADIMQGYTALGAAVAVADFDGDGYDDLFLTDSGVEGKNRLYRNEGDFTFRDVSSRAGIADSNDERNASADALWFDYDNDGRVDLFVVRFGASQLFRNLGDGRFRDVTHEAGLDRRRNAITAVAFDYDRDSDLDLFVGSYFQDVDVFSPDTPRFFPESFETAENGGGVAVYRNNGHGRFDDVSREAGFAISGWTLDLGHADADNDGDEDLYVAADFGADSFFVNNGDGTFTNRTEKAIGIDTKKGMNIDWGDYDNDGLLDAFVTNITDEYMREGNFLWHNNGDLTFTDVARETETDRTGWGWGGKFFDYDNDGWLDLFTVNGWVSAGEGNYVVDIFAMITTPGVDFADARNWPPMGTKSLSGYQRSRLFRNLDGTGFRDEAARHGVDSIADGRGIGVADFDNDGRLDLIVANADAEPELYRNEAPAAGHWIAFSLEGTTSNRTAVGAQARLTVNGETLLRFVDGGNSFAGQSSRRLHFGLGEATTVDNVEVRWPLGTRERFGPLKGDRIHKLVEGSGKAKRKDE